MAKFARIERRSLLDKCPFPATNWRHHIFRERKNANAPGVWLCQRGVYENFRFPCQDARAQGRDGGESGRESVTAMHGRAGKVAVKQSSDWSSLRVVLLGASLALAGAGQGMAFDPEAGVNRQSEPFALFKFGFTAYKKGRKDEAVEAYRDAAEQGHTGSRWALANMYAYGDGVAENDLEAFKIYSDIASQGVEPGSEDTGYFVNALISLAGYYRRGIPGSPVHMDLDQARQLYFQAASTFGVAEAQFQLARMLLTGEGGTVNVQQAKKWLNRARKNGHAGAMAVFGNVIFQEGQTARGLAYMTAALDQCTPKDRPWLQTLQEEAFSLATENDRRKAIEMSQGIHLDADND